MSWIVAKLVLLAFSGSIGMTLVILACWLPDEPVWWPLSIVPLYALAPLPTLIAQRFSSPSLTEPSKKRMELAIFISMGFVVSSFALPVVLARAPDSEPVITWTACGLTLSANLVVYLTFFGFFLTVYQEDSGRMW